jgi:hypothetical protein
VGQRLVAYGGILERMESALEAVFPIEMSVNVTVRSYVCVVLTPFHNESVKD